MSGNQIIGVEYRASTAAAVAEVQKLAEAMREETTAADAAGKGQKTLGKEIAATRALQLEATEASRKAGDAAKIHALTLQKLGAASKEAKESAAKLAAAQAESKRAATAAAAALGATAKAVAEAARAEDGQLSPATKRAAAQIERMGKDAQRTAHDLRVLDLQSMAAAGAATSLDKAFRSASAAGKLMVAGGVAAGVGGLVVGLKAAGTSAIEFQSTMTGISKVLDDQSPENLEKVDRQIKAMAIDLGVLPGEIGAMTQALAASGLQSDLVGYTEDAAKLGVAFDLSGQEAGHAIASLTASLGLSRGEMQSLMGTINELDDGMNSSSKQLVTYLEEVAGIGRAASISGETMLALGSAIISTGSAPDKAATGVKNFIATMESGKAATDLQVKAFHALGFQAEEVAKQMATGNAEQQIKAISAALAGLPPEERFATMIQLFGKESIGSVGGLATNVDLLGDAFKIAGDKAAAAGSVQAEYERVSKTTAHSLAQLKANVAVTAVEVGSVLLPEINRIAHDMSAWVTENRELIKVNVAGFVTKATTVARDLWPVLVKIASAAASVTSAIGAGNLAYLGMAGKVASLTGGLGGLASTIAGTASKMATTLIPALAGVGGKLAALAGPAGLLALATAGVAALSFAALKYLLPVESAFDKIALAALTAERRMRDVRIEAMRGQAAKLGEENTKQAADNARRTKILEAGYTNEGMAEAAAAAGMEARRKALHGRRLAQLSAEDKDLVKASVKRAMIAEKLAYMERADAVGKSDGTPAPIEDEDKKKKKGGTKKVKEMSDPGDVARARIFDGRDVSVSFEPLLEEEAAQRDRLYELKVAGFERDQELLDAAGQADEEAQAARERLALRRLDAEKEFAAQQMRFARTDAQREAATTRMEAQEHQRRLMGIRKMAAVEEAENARKVALMEKVTGRVSDLGTAMVQAAWDAAEGQRGAGLQALGDYLKTVSKQMAVKALVETALGVSALAGVVTAGLAPGHFAAAGIAAGVAVAAGGAGIGLSMAGDARAANGKTSSSSSGAASGGVADAADGTERQKRELDAQDVPLSHSIGMGAGAAANGGVTNNYFDLSGGMWGSGGPEKAAQTMGKMLRQGAAAGSR